MNIWLIDVFTSTFKYLHEMSNFGDLYSPEVEIRDWRHPTLFFFVLAVQIIQITNQRNVVFHAHKYIYGKLLSLFCHMIWMS